MKDTADSTCVHDRSHPCFRYLEAESHYFAGQAVSSEECLHGVGQLHLFREHVPQQLVQQVAGVEQSHQDSG